MPDRVGEAALRSLDARIAEAVGLAQAIGIDVVGKKAFRLRQIRPASLFGKGQVEEIASLAEEYDVTLLVIDASLSPVRRRGGSRRTRRASIRPGRGARRACRSVRRCGLSDPV